MEVKTPPLPALDPNERERRFRDIQRRVGGIDGISSVGSASPRVGEEGPPSLKNAEESGSQAPAAAPAPVLSAPPGTPDGGTAATPAPANTNVSSGNGGGGSNSVHGHNYTSSPSNNSSSPAMLGSSQPSSITPSARDSPKKPLLSSPRSRSRGIPSPSSRSRGGALNWKKGKLLGQGGFGTVYLGLAEDSGQLIAVKHVSTVGADKESIAQLRNEVELMEKLKHKSIVQYIGMEENVDVGYVNIFMEFVPGGPISSVLTEFGPFTHEVASSFARQVIDGLVYLHGKGVVHRDIKGANILVHSDADVRLADFGAAVQLAKVRGMRLRGGTAFWMPPEVIVEEITAPVTWRQDIWSLGCLVIEMLTAKPPFKWLPGTDEEILLNIANTEIEVPMPPITLLPAAESFLRLCLQKDPAKRPEAKELMNHDFIKLSEGNPALKEKEENNKSNPTAALSPRTKGKRTKDRTPKGGPPLSPTDRARLDRKLQKHGEDSPNNFSYPQSRTVPGSPEFSKGDRQSFLNTSLSNRRRSTNSITKTASAQLIQWASSGSDGEDGGGKDKVSKKKSQKPPRDVTRKRRVLDFTITLPDEDRGESCHGLVFTKSLVLESVTPGSLGFEAGLSAATGWLLVRIDGRPAMVASEVTRILGQSKTDRQAQASMQTFQNTPPEPDPRSTPPLITSPKEPSLTSPTESTSTEVAPITLKLIQYKLKDEVEVLRSSKSWHKCNIFRIDKVKNKVVVLGTQGVNGEEKNFSKELFFPQMELLLRTPRGSPKAMGTPSLAGISIPLTPLNHVTVTGDDIPSGMLSPMQSIPKTGSVVSAFAKSHRNTPGSPTREYPPGSPDGVNYPTDTSYQRVGSANFSSCSPTLKDYQLGTRTPPLSGGQVTVFRDPQVDGIPSPTGLSTVGSGIFKTQYTATEQSTISPTGLSAKGSGVFGANRGLGNPPRGRNTPNSLRQAAANEAAANEDSGSPLNSQQRGGSPFAKNKICERRGADSIKLDLNQNSDNNSFGGKPPTRCSTADTEVLTQQATFINEGGMVTPNILSPPERLMSPLAAGDQSVESMSYVPGARSSFRSKVAAFIQGNAINDPSTQQWSTPNFMPPMASPHAQFGFSSPPSDAIDEALKMSCAVEAALFAVSSIVVTAVVFPPSTNLGVSSRSDSLPSKRNSYGLSNPILSAARDMYISTNSSNGLMNVNSSGPLLSPKTALESETVGEASAPVAPSPTLAEVKPLAKRPRARTVSAVPTSSWGALGSDRSKRSAEIAALRGQSGSQLGHALAATLRHQRSSDSVGGDTLLSVASRGSEQRTLSSCPSDQPPPVTGKPTGQLWSRRLDGSNNNNNNNANNNTNNNNNNNNNTSPANNSATNTPTNGKENGGNFTFPKMVQISSVIVQDTDAGSASGDVSIAVQRVESVESIEVTSPDYEQQRLSEVNCETDITSDWRTKDQTGHKLTLLLGALMTRAVIPESCSGKRIELVNEAVSEAAAAPHQKVAACLQQYGWTEKFSFAKPLSSIEAGDLAWSIQKQIQVAIKPSVISLPIDGDLGVSWVPSSGIFIVVDVRPDSSAEKFGICVGMRLLCIEGKRITSQALLTEMLEHIQQEREAIISFYPDIVDSLNLDSSPQSPLTVDSPTELSQKNSQFWESLKKKALLTNVLIMFMCAVAIVLVALIFNHYLLLCLLLLPLIMLI